MKFSDLPHKIRRDIHFKTSEDMGDVEDGEVQAVITSPPYWNMKDYQHPNQIGYGESYERYHKRLDTVWRECQRVLNNSGTMWIVINKLWRNGQILHIPYHIARRCQKLGFFLKEMIIWNKPTAIAGMNKRNLVDKHETIVVLSKDPENYKIKVNDGTSSSKPDYNNDGTRLTDLWRFAVKAGSLRKTPDHKSPYPYELIERIVRISTEPEDIVLDPFLGSGTTARIVLKLNRRCIGYEINPIFRKTIAQQLQDMIPLVNQKRINSLKQ